jgi:Flp pilus assembly protein TadD
LEVVVVVERRLRCLVSMSRVRPNTKLYAILRLRRAGRLREALAELRKLAHERPNDGTVYFYLAVTLDNIGREREAIPRHHRALRLNPRHPHAAEINLYLASSYRKTGRPRAARRWLEKAEAIGADGPLQRRLRRLLDSSTR